MRGGEEMWEKVTTQDGDHIGRRKITSKIQRLLSPSNMVVDRFLLISQNIPPSSKKNNTNEGPTMQPQNGPAFLIVLTYACDALIACTKQLDLMSEEEAYENYGTKVADIARAIKLYIKEGNIDARRPGLALLQISRIIKEGDEMTGGMYMLFFKIASDTFLAFQEAEPLTADMWLDALTRANDFTSRICEKLIGNRTILDALIPAERKLRDALKSGLNPVDAFGEAVKAAETSAMQTLYMSGSDSVNLESTNCKKVWKYPNPEAHSVGIWMRAVYEGFKLKFGNQFNV